MATNKTPETTGQDALTTHRAAGEVQTNSEAVDRELRRDPEPVLHPHQAGDRGFTPATQGDSIIGYNAETGEPVTKAEVFPPDSPLLEEDRASQATNRGAELSGEASLRESERRQGAAGEQLDLDQPPQYEPAPEGTTSGWHEEGRGAYSGDLRGPGTADDSQLASGPAPTDAEHRAGELRSALGSSVSPLTGGGDRVVVTPADGAGAHGGRTAPPAAREVTEANQFEASLDAEAVGGRGSHESYPEAADLEPNTGLSGTAPYDASADRDQSRPYEALEGTRQERSAERREENLVERRAEHRTDDPAGVVSEVEEVLGPDGQPLDSSRLKDRDGR